MADENTDSILDGTKKLLGLPAEYDPFDQDVIVFINSAFSTLHSLGIGPREAFSITDKASTWPEFIGETKGLESVKEYVYLKVRTVFDPPSNSFTLDAFKQRIDELQFRLYVAAETPVKEL